MQIFNVGIMEVAFVLVIVLFVYNPKDLSKNIQTATKTIRSVKKSEVWKDLSGTFKEIKDYPQKLKDMIEIDLNDDPEPAADKTRDKNKKIPPKRTQEAK